MLNMQLVVAASVDQPPSTLLREQHLLEMTRRQTLQVVVWISLGANTLNTFLLFCVMYCTFKQSLDQGLTVHWKKTQEDKHADFFFYG